MTASSAFLFAACASVAAAPANPAPAVQSDAGQWRGQNLKIFPADTPRPQLIAAMRNFSSALGVECTFCHAGTNGAMDFPSDAKQEKATARMMIAMVKRLNQQEFQLAAGANAKVTCYTCHRGAAHPLTAPLTPGEKPKEHTH